MTASRYAWLCASVAAFRDACFRFFLNEPPAADGAGAPAAGHVPRALAELGSFENPAHKPLDDAPRRGEWTWRRSAVSDVKTVRGRIAQNAGTSSVHRDVLADDGGHVTVSRTGRLDMAGLAREQALDPVLMFQASMLEDVLQTVRAASQPQR